jgi:hypothetical protein
MDDIKSSTNLLSKERKSSDEDWPARPWQDSSSRWRKEFTYARYFVPAILFLCLTNVITILCVLILIFRTSVPPTEYQSCPAALNEPPKGVAHSMKSLITQPKARMLNATFYNHDNNIYRKNSSDEVDMAWFDYIQFGQLVVY